MTEKRDDIQVHQLDKIYIGNFSLNAVVVLSTTDNKIIKRYDLLSGTTDIFSDSGGNIYAVSSSAGTIQIIRRDETIEVLNFENEGYAAVDDIVGRIYTTKNHKLNIYDLATGEQITSVSGLNKPSFIKLDTKNNAVYIIDGNCVKIFDTVTLEFVDRLYVSENINHIYISDENILYIAYGCKPLDCGIQVYDLFKKKLINMFNGSELINPGAMAVDGCKLYVANDINKGNIRIIDLTDGRILPDIIKVGVNPTYMLAIFKLGRIYVTNSGSGTVSIIEVSDKKVKSILIGVASQPCCIAAYSYDDAIDTKKSSEQISNLVKGDMKSYMYIIAKKVFSSYQQRMCFPIVNIPIPDGAEDINFEKILFENGSIVEDSLILTPIEDREDHSRVQMSIDIPYRVVLSTEQGNILNIKGSLPQIYKDIVVMIPHSRDEFKYEIVVDTKSEQLNPASISEGQIRISVGVFILIKIVGEVEIKIEDMAHNDEPPECEEYEDSPEEDVCKAFLDFTLTPFPKDFFPVDNIK